MNNFIDFIVKMEQLGEAGEFDKLHDVIRSAEEIFIKSDKYLKLFKLYNVYQRIVMNNNRYDLYIEGLLRFVNLHETLSVNVHTAYYYNAKGILAIELGDHEDSLHWVEETLKSLKGNNNITGLTNTLNNKAVILVNNKDYSLAQEVIDQALKLVKDYFLEGTYPDYSLLMLKARVNTYKGKHQEAYDLLEKIKSFERYNVSNYAKMYHGHALGELLGAMGKYNEAIKVLNQCVKYAKEINVVRELDEYYLLLAEFNFKIEKLDESEKYKDLHDQITKDLIRSHNETLTKKAEVKIQLEKSLGSHHIGRDHLEEEVTTIDVLTELYNKSFYDSFVNNYKDEPDHFNNKVNIYLGLIRITNVTKLVEDSSSVYGDKVIYECSNILSNYKLHVLVSRYSPYEFAFVYECEDVSRLEREMESIVHEINCHKTFINDIGHKLECSWSFSNYEELLKNNEDDMIDGLRKNLN